ncbi:unnamed protein product [Pleuronectes platessa]|uniref:Uncharacterized protein n=1 Tax=Pleuronectes platessa TaxID=8262 RepID=A0A9N7U636_PLEPL|nr:unnamed protein product [Pleuronectes platessa]
MGEAVLTANPDSNQPLHPDPHSPDAGCSETETQSPHVDVSLGEECLQQSALMKLLLELSWETEQKPPYALDRPRSGRGHCAGLCEWQARPPLRDGYLVSNYLSPNETGDEPQARENTGFGYPGSYHRRAQLADSPAHYRPSPVSHTGVKAQDL